MDDKMSEPLKKNKVKNTQKIDSIVHDEETNVRRPLRPTVD